MFFSKSSIMKTLLASLGTEVLFLNVPHWWTAWIVSSFLLCTSYNSWRHMKAPFSTISSQSSFKIHWKSMDFLPPKTIPWPQAQSCRPRVLKIDPSGAVSMVGPEFPCAPAPEGIEKWRSCCEVDGTLEYQVNIKKISSGDAFSVSVLCIYCTFTVISSLYSDVNMSCPERWECWEFWRWDDGTIFSHL